MEIALPNPPEPPVTKAVCQIYQYIYIIQVEMPVWNAIVTLPNKSWLGFILFFESSSPLNPNWKLFQADEV
jgi:hypothetical protein